MEWARDGVQDADIVRSGRVGSARSDGGMSGLTGVCLAWSAAAGFADDFKQKSN